jgi:hypothetical protein
MTLGHTENSIPSHLAFAVQLSLGIVFLLSAIPKLRHPLAFARDVAAYDILPAKLSYPLAFALIPLEALMAFAFLTGWLMDVALPLAAFVLVTFLIAVGINLRRGRTIPCGCFGDTSEVISARTAVRLLLLLFAIALLVVIRGTGVAAVTGIGLAFVQASTDMSVILYLLQSIFFAVFLVLLTTWILNLPELIYLARHLGSGRFLSGDARVSSESE